MQVFFLIRTVISGNKNINADGKSNEEIGQKIDKRTRTSDSTEWIVSGEVSDYNDIGRIKKKLKHAWEHQRYGK